MATSTRDMPDTALEFIERHVEERLRPDWAQQALADPLTRYLICRGTAHLIQPAPDAESQAHIAFLSPAQFAPLGVPEVQQLLLGWFESRRCVLVELPDSTSFQPPGTRYEELRPLLPQVGEAQARLLTYARALLVWRARHRYCGVCGSPTVPRSAGHVLQCSSESCHSQVFPRLDPAIIVLVTQGEHALLGRQPSWPPGRFSTLAGFVEPGESLEEAVAREVHEETGARVRSVRYFSSQPWPFPASLMLGFHAQAAMEPIQLDGELEEARWFERAELQAGKVLLPPPHTIARRLLEAWFAATPAP
ncbi:MAG TPA: NAD(+) diphosphatase [Steroidobacteraceae bacterium]|nr:NAD(+) diphosphatase [Steroidobacteraceae bacterium]